MRFRFFYLIVIFLLASCANPVAPTGGDKDIVPPQILLSQPENGMLNYQGKKIELRFDEYFVFSSSSDKLQITPALEKMPKFIVKGKSLIIELPDSLMENTTYSISFLGAIKDFTEGNVLDYYKYVFSTGPYIDSSSLSGTAFNAMDKKPMENITVGLYSIEDTAVLSVSKPIYLARTNSAGQFKIDYIKDAFYVVAAIDDKNLNYIFDQSTEAISLPSLPLHIKGNLTLEQGIAMFLNEAEPSVSEYKLLGNNKLVILFNQELSSINLDIPEYREEDVLYFSKFQDSLFYSWSDTSLKEIHVYYSIDQGRRDSLLIPLAKNVQKRKLSLVSCSREELKINLPYIIKNINREGLSLLDSAGNSLEFKYEVFRDQLSFSRIFESEHNYKLKIDSGAIEYFTKELNDRDFMLEFEVLEEKAKSNLIINMNSVQSEGTRLDLLLKDKKIRTYDLSGLQRLNIDSLSENTYNFKIYSDANRNGRWDTGSFEQKREAEFLWFFSSPVDVKSDWDKELNISF